MSRVIAIDALRQLWTDLEREVANVDTSAEWTRGFITGIRYGTYAIESLIRRVEERDK